MVLLFYILKGCPVTTTYGPTPPTPNYILFTGLSTSLKNCSHQQMYFLFRHLHPFPNEFSFYQTYLSCQRPSLESMVTIVSVEILVGDALKAMSARMLGGVMEWVKLRAGAEHELDGLGIVAGLPIVLLRAALVLQRSLGKKQMTNLRGVVNALVALHFVRSHVATNNCKYKQRSSKINLVLPVLHVYPFFSLKQNLSLKTTVLSPFDHLWLLRKKLLKARNDQKNVQEMINAEWDQWNVLKGLPFP